MINRHYFTFTAIALGLCALLGAGLAVAAKNPNTNAIMVYTSPTKVTFAGGTVEDSGFLKVRVAGPKGHTVFEASSDVGLLDWVLPANLPDGRYDYDAWFTPAAATQLRKQARSTDSAAEEIPLPPELRTRYNSGTFVIKEGVIVPQWESAPHIPAEQGYSKAGTFSMFDNFLALVVQFLVPAAHAADATITDSTPALKMEDTSDSDGTDWLFMASEAEIFIRDTHNFNKEPFVIEVDTPDNSLYIESTGSIGLGTRTPKETLHILDGSPGIWFEETSGNSWRVEQLADKLFFGYMGSSAGDPNRNEDVMVLGPNGNVGIGTSNPGSSLHVQLKSGAQVRVENTTHTPGDDFMFWLKNADGKARFAIESGGVTWTFDNDAPANAFAITRAGDDRLREFYIEGDGDGHFTGNVYANGVKLTSSRTLKTGFTAVNETTLLNKVAALDISQWHYKSDPETVQHIGPMAEQFHALFDLGDGKHLDMVNTTGITFAAIQALEAENNQLRRQIKQLKAAVRELSSTVTARHQPGNSH